MFDPGPSTGGIFGRSGGEMLTRRKGTATSCELKLIDCPSETDSKEAAIEYQKLIIRSIRDCLVEATDSQFYAKYVKAREDQSHCGLRNIPPK